MVNVAPLFSPQHATKAAQALKSHKWTQLEYTRFLERVARHRAAGRSPQTLQMPRDTLKTLFNYLPKVSNPLLRRVCLDSLQSLGSNDYKHETCASFLASECYEEACEYIDPASESCQSLVAFGGAAQVYSAVQHTDIAHALWSRLFEAVVSADNYEAAKTLWLRADRPSTKALGEDVVLRFVELIGRYKDKAMLKQFLAGSGPYGELALKSGPVAACFNCFAEDSDLWQLLSMNEVLLSTALVLQDARFISDALAAQTLSLFKSLEARDIKASPLLGNLLLQGIYRQSTSRSVLHAYRALVDRLAFEPDQSTARILANAAYRLGNSKLLSYEIWKEFAGRNIELDRRFYETTLMCQLVGSGFRSALFFVSEMYRQGIPLRGHIQRAVFNKFERAKDSAIVLDLFQKRRPQSAYPQFDVAQAEAECEPLGLNQAQANAEVFVHGQNPETDAFVELENMLAFDKRKRSAKALTGH